MTTELRDAYLRLGGNVAAVWREAREQGGEPAPLRTLQAAVARELSSAERASARRGEAGRREHGLYLRYEAPHRNAAWQADHKQLPVLVVPPGRQRGRRPWVTLFLDDFSRAIMGWAISLQPSSAEVLAALRDAILINSGRGPFGGVPGRLRWDHGLEFAATAVEQAALALGVDVDPATPYAPHEKGKIERLRRTSATASSPGCPRGRAGRVTTAAGSRRQTHHWRSPSWWPALTPGCAPTTPSGRTAASAARCPCSAGRLTQRHCGWWRPRTRGGC